MPDLLNNMSEFQRQHPVAASIRAFCMIKGNMITILFFLYVRSQRESFSFWIWLGGGAAFLLTAGFLNWWRFLFKIEDDTLHIKRGIFVRRDLYMTRDRVQVIDITSDRKSTRLNSSHVAISYAV